MSSPAEFYSLACRYARGSDRRDAALLLSTFTLDGKIVMPGNEMVGHEQIAGVPTILADMFECTQHKVMNQTVDVNGDRASGETYCQASHIRLKDGQREVEDWAIRYQDDYVLQGDSWLFTRRELVIDWVEIRPVMAFGEQF